MLSERFPEWRMIYPVYGVVIAMLYGWSLYWFFWSLPAWLMFQTAGEIITQLWYLLAISLVESLIVLVPLVISAALLPPRWLRDDFVYTGTLLAVGALGIFMYAARHGADPNVFWYSPLILVAVGALRWVAVSVPGLYSLVIAAAQRFEVFVYLLFPLGCLGLLVVALRNLL